MPQSRSRTEQKLEGVVIVIVLAFAAFLSYYYYTYSVESVTTTTSTSAPSTTSLISSNESMTTTASTSTPSTTTLAPLLKSADFNLTISNGCTFTNLTTGQTDLLFILTVTNRFNASIHYVNESVIGNLTSINGEKPSSIPFSVSRPSSDYTERLVLFLTVPIGGIPSGALDMAVRITAHAEEVKGPILLLSQIRLSQTYTACSA